MYTIKQLLQSGVQPWYRVLSPLSVSLNREIDYISAQELPLRGYVRKNELILVTLPSDNEDIIEQYVREAAELGACGIFAAIKGNRLELSKHTEELLVEKNMPVVLGPIDVKAADVIEYALQKIRPAKTEEREKYEKLREELIDMFLRKKGLENAVSFISHELGRDVLVTEQNTDNRYFSRNGKTAIPDNDLKGGEAFPININGMQIGSIEIFTKRQDELNFFLFDRLVVNAVALWLNEKQHERYVKQNSINDFVWQLALDTGYSQEEMLEKGSYYGFNLGLPYTCVAVRVETAIKAEEKGDGSLSLSGSQAVRQERQETASSLHIRADLYSENSRLETVREILIMVSRSGGRQSIVTNRENIFIIYAENRGEKDQQNIYDMISAAEIALKNRYPESVCRWGISEISTQGGMFAELYKHAMWALRLSLANRHSGINTYSDTYLYNILSEIKLSKNIGEIEKAVLGPIIDYDKKNNASLLETLKCYLEYRNESEVARKMFLHRQTVIYRLKQIETITNMSLNESDNILLLGICVKLYMGEETERSSIPSHA